MDVAPKNDINRHISQEILSQLIQKESFFSKSLVLKTHLKKCQRCSEIINIKNYLQQIAGRTKPVESESHPDTSDLDDSIARIYDSSLSKQEAADFLYHISSCNQCFEYVSFVLEDSLMPIPEEIEQQIAALTDISLAEMVLKEIPPQESIFQKILSKIKKSADKIKEGGFVPVPEPQPGPSLAMRIAVPVSLVAAIAFAIFLIPTEPPAYTYEHEVPHFYTRSTLRGGSETTYENTQYQTLREQFIHGIIAYLSHDYNNAIHILKTAESSVDELVQKTNDEKIFSEIRDYYFYLGVSHFALSRSQKLDLAADIRADNRSEAIKYLLKAVRLAQSQSSDKRDREIYFLGLAYGFEGQYGNAIEQLQMIKAESQFYDNSVDLIEKWSK